MGRQILKHYKSKVQGKKPAADILYEGEIAINLSDEKLFFKNTAGDVAEIDSTKNTMSIVENLITEITRLIIPSEFSDEFNEDFAI